MKRIVNALWGGDEGLDFLIGREDCQLRRQLMLSMKVGDGGSGVSGKDIDCKEMVIKLSADDHRNAQNSLQWRKGKINPA